MKRFIKWLLPAIIVGSGFVAVKSAPETIESFLPTVKTINPSKSEYSKSINGTGIITYNETSDRWFANIIVNEADISFVKPGQTARLSGAAFEPGVYTGKVIDMSKTARQLSNGISVETVVDVTLEVNPVGKSNPEVSPLRAGYTVKARISAGKAREILTVPYEVILQDDVSEFVYLLKNRKAVRQNIITGEDMENGAELIHGLSPNDEIIISPENISENMLVKKEVTTQ
ncbi:MAG: hypothetical protein LBR74_01130 [Eubacterium sp.]|jgi:HlyD family secretion protein|nr:hypothetical protein [Eubacterium sp.]